MSKSQLPKVLLFLILYPLHRASSFQNSYLSVSHIPADASGALRSFDKDVSADEDQTAIQKRVEQKNIKTLLDPGY